MDPYTGEVYADGDLPVLRRQRLQGHRGERARAVHRPGRVDRLRAGLGVQDDDRGGRARGRDGDAGRPASRTSARSASTTARRRSTTPTARAWAGCRSRTASPTRATSSPPRSRSGLGKTTRESSAILYDMWLRLGYGQPTGIDVAGEVGGHRARPGPHALARDRPRQRRVRPGRRGHPDPAGDRVCRPDERRAGRPAARRQDHRRARCRDRTARRGHRREACPPTSSR